MKAATPTAVILVVATTASHATQDNMPATHAKTVISVSRNRATEIAASLVAATCVQLATTSPPTGADNVGQQDALQIAAAGWLRQPAGAAKPKRFQIQVGHHQQ